MPLYGLLKNQGFEPLQIEAMALAFEAVCVERKLRALNDDTARERIARLIIEVARTGELDPIKLRDKVTAILSTPPAA